MTNHIFWSFSLYNTKMMLRNIRNITYIINNLDKITINLP